MSTMWMWLAGIATVVLLGLWSVNQVRSNSAPAKSVQTARPRRARLGSSGSDGGGSSWSGGGGGGWFGDGGGGCGGSDGGGGGGGGDGGSC